MESELTVRRQLLPPGYAIEYKAKTPVSPRAVPPLVDGVLHALVPPEAWRDGVLENLKGRDAYAPSAPVPNRWLPRSDELLFAAGNILADQDDGRTVREDPFQIRIATAFASFQGSHDITHSTRFSAQGALPGFVNPASIGRIFPLEVTALRFGLELFESRRFLASLGFAPIVTQTLSLELYTGMLYLTITAEGLRQCSQPPLGKDGLGARLDQVLAQAGQTAWSADYRQKLAGAGCRS